LKNLVHIRNNETEAVVPGCSEKVVMFYLAIVGVVQKQKVCWRLSCCHKLERVQRN